MPFELDNDYKMLRATSTSYYKLSELAGLMTAITGQQTSLTEILDLVVFAKYPELFGNMMETLSDPKRLSEIRAVFAKKQDKRAIVEQAP